jgi:hypothetical protein
MLRLFVGIGDGLKNDGLCYAYEVKHEVEAADAHVVGPDVVTHLLRGKRIIHQNKAVRNSQDAHFVENFAFVISLVAIRFDYQKHADVAQS